MVSYNKYPTSLPDGAMKLFHTFDLHDDHTMKPPPQILSDPMSAHRPLKEEPLMASVRGGGNDLRNDFMLDFKDLLDSVDPAFYDSLLGYDNNNTVLPPFCQDFSFDNASMTSLDNPMNFQGSAPWDINTNINASPMSTYSTPASLPTYSSVPTNSIKTESTTGATLRKFMSVESLSDEPTQTSSSQMGLFSVAGDDLNLKKRYRRRPTELNRGYECVLPECDRRYEAWRSLQHHLRANHGVITKVVKGSVYIEENLSGVPCLSGCIGTTQSLRRGSGRDSVTSGSSSS
eukprot:CFRG4670T1